MGRRFCAIATVRTSLKTRLGQRYHPWMGVDAEGEKFNDFS
jgi:hypothetical protein